MISCHGNDLFINKKNKTIYSNHEIEKFYIETNEDMYYFYCKKGHKGDKSIRLDSIPTLYLIEKNGCPISIHDNIIIRNNYYNLLQKNEVYIVSNATIGDATAYSVSFRTDSIARIIYMDEFESVP